jgi:ribosomal protein L7/L12
MCVLDIKDLEDDFKKIKKRFDTLDILEPIINKIIPEYQDVPLEYKVLLLKERTANQFITTSEFGFNEDQINQLAEALIISKIHLIKKLRELTGPNGLGLKEAKDYIESKISSFNIKISFPEARKIILENF